VGNPHAWHENERACARKRASQLNGMRDGISQPLHACTGQPSARAPAPSSLCGLSLTA